MAKTVNLDAMIPREDFEIDGDESHQSQRLGKELKLFELESSGITYSALRKPDFQRQTESWDPAKVADFIKSFVDGDLIPAIIMWRSPKTGNLFVIDGAHRLSALIAWIHDDYGDAILSWSFFQGMIEPQQQKAADETRTLIKEQVGTYVQLKQYPLKPDSAPSELALRRGRNMGSFTITLQWVDGDAKNAENSFFKINQSASKIDETELALIKSRKKPNAIATRALIRAGTGHKYWSSFSPRIVAEIEVTSKAIYDNLFLPILEYPVKTLDLPAADRSVTARSISMIFDLANYINTTPESLLTNDDTGEATLSLLKKIENAAAQVFGPDPGSLGLHPAIYCYGATGRFQATAFLAAIAFVQELKNKRAFNKFTTHRKKFEEYLLNYKYFLNQISKNYPRSATALRPIAKMYEIMLDGIENNKSDSVIIAEIKSEKSLNILKVATDEDVKHGRNFTKSTKNAVYISEALAKELTCGICGARLYFKAISHDHKIRRADGGTGAPSNAQLTHPYCNTGYKESGIAANQKKSKLG